MAKVDEVYLQEVLKSQVTNGVVVGAILQTGTFGLILPFFFSRATMTTQIRTRIPPPRPPLALPQAPPPPQNVPSSTFP